MNCVMLYYDVFLLSNYLYFQCQKQKQFSYMISESHLNVLIVFLFKVMDVCNCESVNIVNIGILMYKYWTVNLFVNNHIEIHDEPEVFVWFSFQFTRSFVPLREHGLGMFQLPRILFCCVCWWLPQSSYSTIT